jgi:SAM-dependent methyltransferase
MKLADFEFLVSPLGAQVLADLADIDLSPGAILPLLTRLRKTLTPEQSGSAVEQAELRRRASGKFGADAPKMLFTRDGLEQASDPGIRRYRAEQASRQDVGTIIDACCGIGTDALAFAQAGHPVLGLDLDPLRVEIARYNAAALGLDSVHFAVYDVTQPLPEDADLIFFDPARRDPAGNRLHHVERYLPPLSTLKRWDAPHIWAKLSPAVELEQTAEYGGTVVFHSAGGDLKEAVLQIERGVYDEQRTAAVRHSADGWEAWAWSAPPEPIPAREPGAWLLEPDPALLRAGFVQHLAARTGAAQIDATIAYLTTDDSPDTLWARAWPILDWMPFNLKRLKAYLREHGIGRVTVKKRGHAMTPEQLQAALKLDGRGEERVVVLTRVKGQPAIVICAPVVFGG